MSGQMVPVIWPELRCMYSWSTSALVQSVSGNPPSESAKEQEKLAYAQKQEAVTNFLERVYHGLRNLGVTSPERAINFSATNALNVERIFESALKDEMQLVLGRRQTPKVPVIPVGGDVETFLKGKEFGDWLVSNGLGRLTRRITHWAAAPRQDPPGQSNFFGEYKDSIRGLAEQLLGEVNAAPWWRNHLEGNIQRAFADPRQERQCEWLFDRYRKEFGEITGQQSTSSTSNGLNELVERLGLEVVDKRPRGALWIIGGSELRAQLEPLGFKFAKNGGKATDWRPAWWRHDD